MRILVATDGSCGGGAALDFAARLAARDHETELIVLTVDPADGQSSESGIPHDGDTHKAIDAAVREMREKGTRARFRIAAARSGDDVPEVISREADRVDADLVVVGSEGRDTLSEWVVGGVALRLIYVASRPVTVVRPPRRRKAS